MPTPFEARTAILLPRGEDVEILRKRYLGTFDIRRELATGGALCGLALRSGNVGPKRGAKRE